MQFSQRSLQFVSAAQRLDAGEEKKAPWLQDKNAAKPRCDDTNKGTNHFLNNSVHGCSVGSHICYAFIHVNI